MQVIRLIKQMSLHVRKIYVTDQVKNTFTGQQIVFPIDRVA